MNLELDSNYLEALEVVKKYHKEALGFTNYEGTSTGDKIYSKQNNLEIALLKFFCRFKNCVSTSKPSISSSSFNSKKNSSQLFWHSPMLSHLHICLTTSFSAFSITWSIKSSVYEPGNYPRQTYNEYRITPGYRTHGKRMPTEVLDKRNLIDEGRILNLTAHDPQLWENIIEVWKQRVVQLYIQKGFSHSVQEMYTYLETFLREIALAAWEKFKEKW